MAPSTLSDTLWDGSDPRLSSVELPAAWGTSGPLSAPGGEPSETRGIKVLHLINGEHFSGAERVQDLLGSHLQRFGYAPGFACLKPGRFPKERSSQETPLHEVPMHGRIDMRITRRIREIVTREGYQVLHAHTPRTAWIGARVARKTGLPLVYHVHSPTGRDSTRRWMDWCNQRIELWSLRRADQLITVSQSLAKYMRSLGVPPGKIHVVPNGVPPAPIVRSQTPPCAPWTIGCVALFRPRKGTEVLLRAVAQLRLRGWPLRLLAVGPFESAEYERSLRRLEQELNLSSCVEWTGFTRDVATEIAKMDLFVLPSLFGEGLPMVVLEAMSAGVPIVASEVEGIPEAIRHEKEGLLVPPGDANQLRAGMERFLRQEVSWTTISAQARERHAKYFSALAMARGVSQVYDRLPTVRHKRETSAIAGN